MSMRCRVSICRPCVSRQEWTRSPRKAPQRTTPSKIDRRAMRNVFIGTCTQITCGMRDKPQRMAVSGRNSNLTRSHEARGGRAGAARNSHLRAKFDCFRACKLASQLCDLRYPIAIACLRARAPCLTMTRELGCAIEQSTKGKPSESIPWPSEIM